MAADRVEKKLLKEAGIPIMRSGTASGISRARKIPWSLLHIPAEKIAKTLAFAAPIGANIIILSGDARIDNAKSTRNASKLSASYWMRGGTC